MRLVKWPCGKNNTGGRVGLSSHFFKNQKLLSRVTKGHIPHWFKMAADSPSVFSFLSCLQRALCSSRFEKIFLKVKQAICLEHLFLKKNLLAVLPNGYGKSLVFQVLPHLMKERDRYLYFCLGCQCCVALKCTNAGPIC